MNNGIIKGIALLGATILSYLGIKKYGKWKYDSGYDKGIAHACLSETLPMYDLLKENNELLKEAIKKSEGL